MDIVPLFLEPGSMDQCGNSTVGFFFQKYNISTPLWSDRSGKIINTVVIHYMSAIMINPSNPFAIEHIIDIFTQYTVSAHYVITRSGIVYQCVSEHNKAWHAGSSIMPAPDNRIGVNDFSIGIELLATERSGISDEQYNVLVRLCVDIEKRLGRYAIYVGHDQIAGRRAVSLGLRTVEKEDPGPHFDWNRFRTDLTVIRAERGA